MGIMLLLFSKLEFFFTFSNQWWLNMNRMARLHSECRVTRRAPWLRDGALWSCAGPPGRLAHSEHELGWNEKHYSYPLRGTEPSPLATAALILMGYFRPRTPLEVKPSALEATVIVAQQKALETRGEQQGRSGERRQD
ncbi:hypothetical protein SKAU_G00159100 [Synaphobranchus kaupii]|uniref:Uncharacterized protein n=1 Tax=Synaphobranchus kaupii TaxID=118154 RepID=A0A9Q1IZK7_SYNKA|nr:hypothetical protein SKAU_G00159100 [Synaphobranchus kaupii]